MNNKNMLSAQNVCVGYGKKIVVDGLSFDLEQGRILTLIGPNGVGKSTVLKTMISQLSPISGEVFLCGERLASLGEKEISRRMSVVLTQKLNTDRMTCGDVVKTGRYPYTGTLGFMSDRDMEIVKNAMQMTACDGLYDMDFSCISDGQRQCVMLARAVAQEPKVMLLDEPTSFLDIGRKLQILTLLRKLAAEKNIAVIQSLHEIDLAQKFSDTVLCIKDGKADRIGSPEEIFSDNYIAELYGIKDGSYTLFGTAEPPKVKGLPEVFVIGGGGSGIAVYRKLQRQGIPFAAGVIHENDIEYPVAKALAAEVVTQPSFEPVSLENAEKARLIMEKCSRVICCIQKFGTMNSENERLYENAKKLELL